MAQLKPLDARVVDELEVGFHGGDAAAQLKRLHGVERRFLVRGGFHGGDAVAQLKRDEREVLASLTRLVSTAATPWLN